MKSLEPRMQTRLYASGFVVALLLATTAIVVSNSSTDTANKASDVAATGAAACLTQTANYASSKAFRASYRDELRVTAGLRQKTAKVFAQLANLSRKSSPAQTKILNLALAYSSAATEATARANALIVPTKPNCQAAN